MNVNLPLEFAARLREERKRLGLNQTEFAKATGVHLNTQSRYEKGERTPDTTYLAALARAGVDLVFMLTGERGKDLRREHRAVIHVLNEIQGFLGFWKPPLALEFEQAMRDVYEAQMGEPTDSGAIEKADRRLSDMLRRSPEIFPTPQELEELVRLLRVAQKRAGLTLTVREEADALRRIYRDGKALHRPLTTDEAEALVRSCAFR